MTAARGKKKKRTHWNHGQILHRFSFKNRKQHKSWKRIWTTFCFDENQHKIEKKSSLSAEHGISDETDLVPFYSDIFYEEKVEPPLSTVSPFGKYQLKFINNQWFK